ncbi:hypothetical protein [Streptomyces dysideae]|uniref:Uncharacterized protein n=1 Tax=Streptomyces dysideae TaxID=909626 RepID=A0A101UZ61_9ACTN|nr:hypothetical protein [Streptomyces dysideae]KUO19513.1 hypothetical protein AQJ91_19340 [Streptomyces dysideae]
MAGDTRSVEPPLGIGALTRTATEQLTCTTAAAHRVSHPSADLVTVDNMADDSGRHVRGADEGCPDP